MAAQHAAHVHLLRERLGERRDAAERDVNILDISQTILQGMFTMTMLVDLAGADFSQIHDGFDALSKQLGVQIAIQREDVFKFMYRL